MIGKELPLRDAVERVVGTVPFTLDFRVDGMAQAAVLRSPYPHAAIRRIDVGAAARREGVVGVITGADLADDPDIDPFFGAVRADQPVLAIGKTRHVGEPVVLVIAETRPVATAALAEIEVEYEELPFVEDEVEASRADVVVHDEFPDNECGSARIRRGDIDEGWGDSDRIYEHEFTTPSGSHVPMEPFVTVAQWQGGHLFVWTASQSPHAVRRSLSKMFGMDPAAVRVRSFNVGGGYGAKGQTKIEPMVACAARVVGRPVRLELSREEVFFTVAKHASTIRIKTGVKYDGRLVARQVEAVWNAGAYAITSPVGAVQGMARAAGPYRIPHLRIDSRAFYTNTVPTGPFRGAMTTQVAWAYESQMDDIAHDLGIDPLEIRLRNLLTDGDVNAVGEVMHDTRFVDLLKDAATAVDWGEPSGPPPLGRVRGKGLAVMMKSTLTPSRSEARLEIDASGGIRVYSSSVEMGQGVSATLLQMVADFMGVQDSSIEVVLSDTAVTPFDTTTSSSRTTFSMGSALRSAASSLKERLAELASRYFEVAEADLVHLDGRVEVVGQPDASIDYGNLLQAMGSDSLDAEGIFQSEGALDPDTGQGVHSIHWHQGAAAVEVEVDLETGKVDVLRCHGSSYAGRMVDPFRVRQQNEGAAIWGLGLALSEELVYESGQPVNPNLSDYMIPSILDVPVGLSTRSLESPLPDAELHGVGEMVTPAVPPAVGNAIRAATGERIRGLPMSPERVLRAIRRGNGGA